MTVVPVLGWAWFELTAVSKTEDIRRWGMLLAIPPGRRSKYMCFYTVVLESQDGVNFYSHTLGQAADFHGGTGRIGLFEITGHDFVNLCELA